MSGRRGNLGAREVVEGKGMRSRVCRVGLYCYYGRRASFITAVTIFASLLESCIILISSNVRNASSP